MADSTYYCVSSHALVVLGQMCINGSDISIEQCHFPLSDVSKAFRYGFGYTVYLIAVIGIMGNLTTLIWRVLNFTLFPSYIVLIVIYITRGTLIALKY